MHVLWNTLAKLDHVAFESLKKIDKLRKKDNFFKRTHKSMEHIHPPEKAIQFDA